jgi:superfamily II DNA helicase RecQ
MHPEYHTDTCSKQYDQLLLRDSGQVTIASIVYLAKENGVIIKRQKRQLTDFELRLVLQNFRTEVYRKENIFAYEVFNNKSLEALVNQRPKNYSELKGVYGFNEGKG